MTKFRNSNLKWMATSCLSALVTSTALFAMPAHADELETDTFYLKIDHQYKAGYWDAGSGADGSGTNKDVTTLIPVVPEGYFYLGVNGVGNYDLIPDNDKSQDTLNDGGKRPNYFLIKPKAGHENLIKAPEKFTQMWSDKDSGGNVDGFFFKAECPSGYHALGGETRRTASVPEAAKNQFACLHSSILTKASGWEKFWADEKSGAASDGSLWTVKHDKQNPSANTLYLYPTTLTPVSGYDAPSEQAYALKVHFQNVPNPFGALGTQHLENLTAKLPSLSGNYEQEAVAETGTYSLPSVDIPFYLVNDPELDMLAQWKESPTYKLVRTVRWKRMGTADYTGNTCTDWDEAEKLQISYTTGSDHQTTWNNTIGGSASVATETSVKPLGIGGGLEFTVSAEYSHEFGGADGTNKSDSKTYEFPVPPGTFVAAYQQFSTYEIKRADGTVVNSDDSTSNDFGDYTLRHVVYRPEGWAKDNPCGTGKASTQQASVTTTASEDDGYMAVMAFEEKMATLEDSEDTVATLKNGFSTIVQPGTKLAVGHKHYNTDKSHYLVFTKEGNLVVRKEAGTDSDSDDDFIWGLRDMVSVSGHIEEIVFQHDGNLAAYGKNGQYMWSALHAAQPKGTILDLDRSGTLSILIPESTSMMRVVWDSEKGEIKP